ncbi:helix-turn-helix transcriptional regulator [Streptomyces gardneri]|nr:helix-turn-helix transcriptional regulator [Streptomyces gardneri]QPK43583.1 helix-turn-helix transcriptional regulator [Streptomyces gardneri]WRK34827.1 helix-turn-helix transcriptional regulator [Streptomyces venezuelae]
MERARLLLAETDLAITVIAMDLGYSSSQHFATAFRRETDTTPSRYRSAVRGGRVRLTNTAVRRGSTAGTGRIPSVVPAPGRTPNGRVVGGRQ